MQHATRRLIILAAVLTALEIGWALYCAVDGVNLFVFYGVLVLASAVFWAPGLFEKESNAGSI